MSRLEVHTFMGADCDTDHYVVLAKVRGRLAVSKEETQKFNVGKFNLRKRNEPKVRKKFQIKTSVRYAALENLSDSEDINWTWENIKESIKTLVEESLRLYELMQYKPRFEE